MRTYRDPRAHLSGGRVDGPILGSGGQESGPRPFSCRAGEQAERPQGGRDGPTLDSLRFGDQPPLQV